MPVIVRLDKIMAERKISSNELAERIGTTPVNLSRIKKGHIRGIRFNTLEQLCLALRCQPGDLLEVMSEERPPRRQTSKRRFRVSRRRGWWQLEQRRECRAPSSMSQTLS